VAKHAYAAAPEFLRALGLAFRCYVVAADGRPGSASAQLLASLSPLYRTFADPQPHEVLIGTLFFIIISRQTNISMFW
jgi:hypothetical protein